MNLLGYSCVTGWREKQQRRGTSFQIEGVDDKVPMCAKRTWERKCTRKIPVGGGGGCHNNEFGVCEELQQSNVETTEISIF